MWDGSYFCAKCALDPKKETLDGTFWNDLKEIIQKIKEKNGYN